MAIRVDLHTGPSSDLHADWRRLHAAQPGATPFMAPGWIQPWWRHFGTDARPLTLVAEDAGAVVGLALLAVRRRGPLRILEPAGMEPGDYWDVLAAPGRAGEVAQACVTALRAHTRLWDAWIVRCLPPESPLEGALDTLRALRRPRIQAPSITLPGSFDEYLETLSSSRRQNLRRHLRRLDEGTLRLREVTDAGALDEAFPRWRGFRAAQWEAAGKEINPVHLSDHFAAFLRDACGALIPEGLAQVWEFEQEDEVVGTYVNFCDAHAYHWYLGGFDPKVSALGLGKIAISHGIRTSIEVGRTRYDFGRGAEEYKYWYGAADRLLAARVAGSGTPRSRLALVAARVAVSRRRD